MRVFYIKFQVFGLMRVYVRPPPPDCRFDFSNCYATVTTVGQLTLCLCWMCFLTSHGSSQQPEKWKMPHQQEKGQPLPRSDDFIRGKAFNISLRPMLGVRGGFISYSRFRRWRLYQVSIKTAPWGGYSHGSGPMCLVSLYYAEWRLCYFRWWIFQRECCNAGVRCFWSINNWEEPWGLKNSWNGGRAMFV